MSPIIIERSTSEKECCNSQDYSCKAQCDLICTQQDWAFASVSQVEFLALSFDFRPSVSAECFICRPSVVTTDSWTLLWLKVVAIAHLPVFLSRYWTCDGAKPWKIISDCSSGSIIPIAQWPVSLIGLTIKAKSCCILARSIGQGGSQAKRVAVVLEVYCD